MDLDTVADELYGLAPPEFTPARDARVAEAVRAGDRGLAAAIKSLRRPTRSAWLVNTLVRQRREQVDELLDLGDTMREAQQQLAGEELRQLSRRRHEVVSALAQQAREVAREAGQPATDEMVLELESTLEAALADPAASEAVRSGRLTAALSYSGFGSVDPGASAVSGTRRRAGDAAKPAPARPAGGKRDKTTPASDERRDAELRAAELALHEAEADAATARREAERADGRAGEVAAEEQLLSSQLAELDAERSRLRGESGSARGRVATGDSRRGGLRARTPEGRSGGGEG